MPEKRTGIPLVFVVILNYNGHEDTIECIESVLKADYGNKHLVVVDNDSSDGSVERISGWFRQRGLGHHVTGHDPGEWKKTGMDRVIIQSGWNGGYGYGNNIGIKYALANGADYVLILNNDTVVDPGFLQPLVDMCENDGSIGIASGKILFHSKPDVIWSNGGAFNALTGNTRHFHYNKKDRGQRPPENIQFASGCMWMIPANVFASAGLINEDFFMYYEDVEFCRRVIAAGYRISISDQSRIWHKTGDAESNFSAFTVYWKSRSFIKLIRGIHQGALKRTAGIVLFFFVYKLRLLRRMKITRILTMIKGISDEFREKKKA